MSENATSQREKSRATVRRLLAEGVWPRRKLYAATIATILGVAIFTALLAWSTKLIVNDVFVSGSADSAWGVAAMVIAISVGMGLAQYANSVISVKFNREIAAQYQRRIFRELVQKNVPYFAGKHAATQMARVMLYGRAAGAVAVQLTNRLATDVLTLIALIIVMIVQDPWMTLMSSIIFPIIGFIVARLTRRVRSLASQEGEMVGLLHQVGAEAFEGIKTVKSYGLEEKTDLKFSDAVMALENRMMQLAKITSLTVPLMQALGGVAIGFFVVYASWQTISLGKTPGEFTAFITAFLLAYQPAERVSKVIVDTQKQLVHVELMYELLDAPNPMRPLGTETLEGRDATLDFDDVVFAYKKDTPALGGVSFTVKPGERIAIVGRSGAGKTTLIDLVQRFYQPDSGSVRIGGVDLTDLADGEIRKNVALISQDVFLFDGTIKDNILDGNPDASDEEVAKAAELAQVTGFAKGFANGLETKIGPNGSNLSGGQKQRVGIARALNKNAKIYIYDEATSALDGENESAIMAATVKHAPESIILFVTHRASTLKWVDRVMMLDAGQIVDFDTHDALMAKNEVYRTLFDMEEVAAAE